MKLIILTLSLLLGIIGLSACSEDKKMNEASNIVSAPDRGFLIESFEELVRHSNLVVIGTVEKVHPASLRNMNADKSENAPVYNAVYTDSDIKVDKIILGNINQGTRDMFTIKEPGGVYNGKEYKIYEPIVEEGKTYLFFLYTYDKLGIPEEPYTFVGTTEEVIIPVEGDIVKLLPSVALTEPLAAKQIIDEESATHKVSLKINDVIDEIIRVDHYLPDPVFNIDNYLPDPIEDVDLDSLK
ncbi:hypothetical protein ACK8P5_05820 [Paenibacillus sp. EC2-1]|uniref:hypothetical protein n=1 Tax=Paenibacillus sp. EC2-1 TaxID=3388665 RepID=UPI003BEEFB23